MLGQPTNLKELAQLSLISPHALAVTHDGDRVVCRQLAVAIA
jgi:hypothetical protein